MRNLVIQKIMELDKDGLYSEKELNSSSNLYLLAILEHVIGNIR